MAEENTQDNQPENEPATDAQGDMGDPSRAAPRWKPLDPVGLKERLAEVRALLVQAAAVGLAQDVAHLERYAELERRAKEGARGPEKPRRYR
jgi:hypothetical protein